MTSFANPATGSTAPGLLIPISCRWPKEIFDPASWATTAKPGREAPRGRRHRQRERPSSTSRSTVGPSAKRGCAATSPSPSSTSNRGCVGSAPPHFSILMEDAATAEISRSQVWQWIRYGVCLKEGPRSNSGSWLSRYLGEELEKIRAFLGPASYAKGRFDEAVAYFQAGIVGTGIRRVPYTAGLSPT